MTKYSSFWDQLRLSKRSSRKRIAFADSTDIRVLKSVIKLIDNEVIMPVLVGDDKNIQNALKSASLPPISDQYLAPRLNSEDEEKFFQMLVESKPNMKIDKIKLRSLFSDALYWALCLLRTGSIDGLVAGSLRSTAEIVKAALQFIGPRSGIRFVSGQFILESEILRSQDETPFLFSDCAVVPEPSPHALALIAMSAGESFRFFTGKEPKVAFLSFSTRDSAEHPLVNRIKEAVSYLKQEAPLLIADGELQVDAALDAAVAKIKHADDSHVAGKANVLVFPTLESGNIAYKLVQRFSKVRIAGPLLWGLNKPMSDLSRGCTSDEIIDTAFCVATMAEKAG